MQYIVLVSLSTNSSTFSQHIRLLILIYNTRAQFRQCAESAKEKFDGVPIFIISNLMHMIKTILT